MPSAPDPTHSQEEVDFSPAHPAQEESPVQEAIVQAAIQLEDRATQPQSGTAPPERAKEKVDPLQSDTEEEDDGKKVRGPAPPVPAGAVAAAPVPPVQQVVPPKAAAPPRIPPPDNPDPEKWQDLPSFKSRYLLASADPLHHHPEQDLTEQEIRILQNIVNRNAVNDHAIRNRLYRVFWRTVVLLVYSFNNRLPQNRNEFNPCLKPGENGLPGSNDERQWDLIVHALRSPHRSLREAGNDVSKVQLTCPFCKQRVLLTGFAAHLWDNTMCQTSRGISSDYGKELAAHRTEGRQARKDAHLGPGSWNDIEQARRFRELNESVRLELFLPNQRSWDVPEQVAYVAGRGHCPVCFSWVSHPNTERDYWSNMLKHQMEDQKCQRFQREMELPMLCWTMTPFRRCHYTYVTEDSGRKTWYSYHLGFCEQPDASSVDFDRRYWIHQQGRHLGPQTWIFPPGHEHYVPDVFLPDGPPIVEAMPPSIALVRAAPPGPPPDEPSMEATRREVDDSPQPRSPGSHSGQGSQDYDRAQRKRNKIVEHPVQETSSACASSNVSQTCPSRASSITAEDIVYMRRIHARCLKSLSDLTDLCEEAATYGRVEQFVQGLPRRVEFISEEFLLLGERLELLSCASGTSAGSTQAETSSAHALTERVQTHFKLVESIQKEKSSKDK